MTVDCTDPRTGEATTFTCDYLVGADGAGSGVGRLLDVEFEGFSWPKEDFVASIVMYPFDKYGSSITNFIIDPVPSAVVTVIVDKLWRLLTSVCPCDHRTKPLQKRLLDDPDFRGCIPCIYAFSIKR